MEEQLSISISKLIDKMRGWLDAIIVNLPNIVLAVFVFFICYYLSIRIRVKVTKLLQYRVKQGSIRGLIGSAISIILIGIGIFLALGILNLDKALNSLIAGAGVAGLAVGLALQGTLANTFAGISLALKNDINIDDFIETNGFTGTVEDINLRDTKIRTVDNNIVMIPNNIISSNPYKNFSLTKDIRLVLGAGVGYESDLREVKSIVHEVIASAFPYRSDDIEVDYLSFGDSAIDLQIRFWIEATTKNTLIKARSEAIIILKERFDKEGINIPYPITTIKLSST